MLLMKCVAYGQKQCDLHVHREEGQLDTDVLEQIVDSNSDVDDSCFLAALLLEAVASTGDSQFASFWRQYKKLLPREHEQDNLIMFDRSQLGWLQVCRLASVQVSVDCCKAGRLQCETVIVSLIPRVWTGSSVFSQSQPASTTMTAHFCRIQTWRKKSRSNRTTMSSFTATCLTSYSCL